MTRQTPSPTANPARPTSQLDPDGGTAIRARGGTAQAARPRGPCVAGRARRRGSTSGGPLGRAGRRGRGDLPAGQAPEELAEPVGPGALAEAVGMAGRPFGGEDERDPADGLPL